MLGLFISSLLSTLLKIKVSIERVGLGLFTLNNILIDNNNGVVIVSLILNHIQLNPLVPPFNRTVGGGIWSFNCTSTTQSSELVLKTYIIMVEVANLHLPLVR